jgi:hypothetical protein
MWSFIGSSFEDNRAFMDECIRSNLAISWQEFGMDLISKIRILKAFLPTAQFGPQGCGVLWATICVGACLLDQPVLAQEGESWVATIAVDPLFDNAVRTIPPMDGGAERFPPQGRGSNYLRLPPIPMDGNPEQFSPQGLGASYLRLPPLPMDGEPERSPPQGNKTVPRKPEGNVQSYLPPQRPIGLLSIDTSTKRKGDSNNVPVDQNRKAFGEPRTVQAAHATELSTVWAPGPTPDSMNFCYQPLYFEEPNLERYGRSCGHLQPALSGMRFFATIPALPYAMTVHRPKQPYIWRWPYEAGWGAPRVRELPPLDAKAGLVQASLLTGLIFVVP